MSYVSRYFPASNEARCWWGVLALSFGAYLWIFLPLLPAAGRPLGHDYSSVLPHLLAGYYWLLRNGPLATPWFTPAQCGGVPYFADLTNGYYTLPQWLAFAVGPVTAVRAAFVIFAALGAAGFCLLLRARFALAYAAATAAAVLFLFSGFFTYRMAVGHFTFHPYVLTPWIAWAALASRPQPAGRAAALCAAAWPPLFAGVLFAYMFQASMVHLMPCAFIAVAVVLLLHGQLHGHQSRPWVFLSVAALVGGALSASRFVAALSFMENFPRSGYPLPGFPGAWALVRTAAEALFWRVSPGDAMREMNDIFVRLDQVEWEYGLGPAALLLLIAGGVSLAMSLRRDRQLFGRFAGSRRAWGVMALALALPLLVNWHEPAWNGFLKKLPYFQSSSNLLRWFSLYIPVVALLAGLALHHVAPGSRRSAAVAVLTIVVTVAWNAGADRKYYTAQRYDGTTIEAAWREARATDYVPPITDMTLSIQPGGRSTFVLGNDDVMTAGYSQINCYNPAFGYRLERFPRTALRPGPALAEVRSGLLNVKNPACYLFPEENECLPGSHFKAERRADAERFLSYEPFPFARSSRQHTADAITLAALWLVAVVALACAVFALFRLLRKRAPISAR